MLTFLPILAIFFASMALLEDVGYMARAAYVMDRFMHAVGLHGKSFMPLFLGFGCNVPAIMGSRIIESRRARLITILLAPLVPCTARLAVLTVLAPVFFPARPTLVSWLLTGLAPGGAGGIGRHHEPTAHQGRAGGVHHGDAALPPAQRAHHRYAGVAAPAGLPAKGGHGDPRRLGGGLGADRAAHRARSKPAIWGASATGWSRWAADGPGLAAAGGAPDQLCGQRERRGHAGRAL